MHLSLEFRKEKNTGEIDKYKLTDAIYVNNLKYCYPLSKYNSIDGMSFNIPAGKMTAIIGPSGSGKSTFIDLLPRLRLLTG